MENRSLVPYRNVEVSTAIVAKQLMAVGARWRLRMALAFVLTVAAAVAAGFLFLTYESEMKILIKRERIDPLVSASAAREPVNPDLSDEVMSAEIELMRSEDVLREVVLAAGLHRRAGIPLWMRLTQSVAADDEKVRIAKALKRLNSRLEISRPKKSNVIMVRYSSSDPQLSADVLRKLRDAYTAKHISAQRLPGRYEFLAAQAEKYRQDLAAAESRLAKFPETGGAVAAPAELDITVKALGDLRRSYADTQTAIRELQERIRTLENQLATTPARMTTAVRTADNPHLMMDLKSTLLKLELKRTDLLQKFQPTYREVLEIEQQIAQTRASIEAAERAPLRDEITDRDPTYEWIRSELTKARTERQALEAKAAATLRSIAEFDEKARDLNSSSLRQQDLMRQAKSLEESYQLYVRKREEARIADALDREKLLNLTVTQEPAVPVLPKYSPTLFLAGGILAAAAVSLGTALVSERVNDSFRAPGDIELHLGVPVLATLPRMPARASLIQLMPASPDERP